MASVAPLQQLAVHASPFSFTSHVLRPASQSSVSVSSLVQTLNVSSLQVLKSRLLGSAVADSDATTGAQRSAHAADPQSLTWLNLQRSLPPSGQAASNPDVAAMKTLHAQLLSNVAALCDDDRNTSALADTAGTIFRALKRKIARETAAREAVAAAIQGAAQSDLSANLAAAATATPGPVLAAELKGIFTDARKEVESAIGARTTEAALRKTLVIVESMEGVQASMQAKYDQLRLLRELKSLPDAATRNKGTLLIPAPRDTTLPALPLLEEEFGSSLPIMFAASAASAEPESDVEDSPEMASSDLASKPVNDVVRQLESSMRDMGITASPAASDDADDDSAWLSEDDEDLYVGESDDDESEREQQRLAALSTQAVRAMHDPKPQGRPSSSSSVEPLELPTTPVGWWQWLISVCDPFVTYNEAGLPVLSSGEIASQILGVLQSSRPDVQNELLDTIGFEGMELLAVLIKYRKELRAITATHQAQARQTSEQRAQSQAQETRRGADGSVVRGLVGISIHSAAELEAARNRKRADRRHARRSARDQPDERYVIDEAKLDAQASQLKGWISANASQSVSQLPAGATRTLHSKEGKSFYEEVIIPPKPRPEIDESELLPIETSFEPFAQQAFPRTKTLNRMQSRVYQSAYHQNNNLLICAPTGAGKTNVAMMCILREVGLHIVNGVLQKDLFKIVYVAPMKALAQEVQSTFQKRLAPLGIIVKELTGDMQLTRAEIKETQIIVTTPEKCQKRSELRFACR